MASDGSDGDDLAVQDLATFASEADDLSPTAVGHVQMNESTHQQVESWNLKGDQNIDHEIMSHDLNSDLQHDQDAFFTSDSDVHSYLTATENNQTLEHYNPFLDADPFNFDSQEPSLSPMFVDPFSDGLFKSDETFNPRPSTDVTNHDSIIDHKALLLHRKDYVYLIRLPGENLGMVLGIEGDQDNRQTIDAVVVKSVTPGGAVARACQGDNRILVGDEILEVENQPLNELTHDECIALFQTMPDNVVLTVCRKEKDKGVKDDQSWLQSLSPQSSAKISKPVPLPKKRRSQPNSQNIISEQFAQDDPVSSIRNLQDISAYEGPTRHEGHNFSKVPVGFHKHDLTLFRGEEDNLGISIVPSYGATCDLYQIKRFLHSGACVQSGLLEVGDRLFACNGQSLNGLTQAQCLNVLKSSGSLVKLTILRQAGNSEQAALSEDSTGSFSTTSLIKTEESFSHSSQLSDIDNSDTITEQRNCLESPEKILIDFGNDAETKEKIIYANNAYENNDRPVNLDDIQLLDTFGKQVATEGDYVLEKTVNTGIDFSDSLHATSPSGISDSEFPNNQGDLPVIVTNIDDLLGGTVENTNTVFSNSDLYTSETTDIKDKNTELLLISLDHVTGEDNSVLTENDLSDTAFTGQSTEEIAEECFNNIGFDINNTKSEKKVNYTETRNSETKDAVLEDCLLNFEDQDKLNTYNQSSRSIKTNITISAVSSSEESISKILLSSVNHSDIPNSSSSESVPFQERSNILQAFTVNSVPPVSISHIDIVSNKHIVQEETCSPVENINNASSSVVFHVGSSSSTLKSATIKVDELLHQDSDMSKQLTSHMAHTTVGVTSKHQLGEEEEAIKPVAIVRDAQGSPLRIPVLELKTRQPNESRILDKEAKQELAGVLLEITKMASIHSNSIPVKNRVEEEVLEQEITPTVLGYDQKQVALGVLNQWNAMDSPNKTAAFHKTVSNIIDIQRQPDRHIVPENALVHTTLGVSNDGQTETEIQPMTAAKDHLGKHLYIPTSQSRHSIQDVKIPDDCAKLEIADVMSSFSTPQYTSQFTWDADQSENVIAEDKIVPLSLSREQKQMALNVLNNWANSDELKEASIIQHAVTEFKMFREPKNTNIASPYTRESFKTSTGNAQVASNPTVRTALPTDVEETGHVSSVVVDNYKEDSAEITDTNVDNYKEDSAEITDTNQATLSHESNKTVDFNTSEHSGLASNLDYNHVILRDKSKQSDFRTKIDHFQQQQDPASSVGSFTGRRVRSMIDDSPITTSSLRFDDFNNSSANEKKPIPTARPLSAVRPLSVSTSNMHHLSSASTGRPASVGFMSTTFANRTSKTDYPKTRQEDGSPFQVDVLKGLIGLGLKVKITPEGWAQITEIQSGGPVDKDGQVRVGDYLLFINSTELTGQTDARVQQILRLLPRGLTKLVVSSAVVSSTENQQQSFAKKSYSSLSSAQPSLTIKSQSTPTVTNDTYLASVSTDELYSSKHKDIHPQAQIRSVDSVEPAHITPRVHLPEKVEQPSKRQEMHDTLITYDKPIPTTRSKHNVLSLKAVPQHGLLYSANESCESASENTGTKEPLGSGLSDGSDMTPWQRNPSGEVSFNSKHDTFEDRREVDKHKATVKVAAVVPNESRTHPVMETSSSFNNDQVASPVSPPLSFPQSPTTADFNKPVVKSELQEKESSVPERKIESFRSPPCKIPPPVAPKPRVSLTSMLKSEDVVDGGELTKPLLTSSYEKQQSTTATISRPSTTGDKTGSFVSSAAEMFDNKATSNDSALDQTLMVRRVSRGVAAHIDSSKMINTSLLPVLDRHKSTLAPSHVPLSRPVTLASSSLPHSRRHSHIIVTHKEDATLENVSNSPLSPTHLNAALSPRRVSSIDSPTSPPHIVPAKYVPATQDKSPRKFLSGKSEVIHQHGIYKSTPLTLLTNKSVSHTSHKLKSSLHPAEISHVVPSEHHSKSFTSPAPSPTLSTKDEALKYNIKKFNNLHMDDASLPQAGSQDHILYHSVENDSLLLSQIADSISHTDDIKKPTALPRRKTELQYSDKEVDITDKEINDGNNKGQKTSKMEESYEGSHIEISSSVIAPVKRNTCDSNVPLTTQEELLKSYRISAEETFETSGEVEKESRHSNEKLKVCNQLLEHDSNVVVNHDQPMQNGHGTVNNNGSEQRQIKRQPIDETGRGEETSESVSYNNNNFLNSLGTEVKYSETQESEVNETEMQILEAQASEIVETVMAKIRNNADLFPQNQKTDITIEPDSPESVEDEPPPLPGAPPPPLILRDTDLLVNAQNLVDQKKSPFASEHIKQPTGNSSMRWEVNTSTDIFTVEQPDVIQEHQASKANSMKPLNHTVNTSYYGSATGVISPAPMDMLSEYLGIPLDEEQERATDDTFSPPGECVESVSHVAEKVPISLESEVELLLSLTKTHEIENLAIHSKDNALAKYEEPFLIDVTCNVTSKENVENDTSDDTLPVPLLPTSSCPSVTAWHSTNNLEDFLSQPFVQASSSPPLLPEVNLLGDDNPPDENKVSAQKVSIIGAGAAAEIKPELTIQSEHLQVVSLMSYPETCTHDPGFQATDTSPVTTTSKRKWCLRSNNSGSSVISGDSHDLVQTDYTVKSLSSSLTLSDLKSVIDKANHVLDAVSAPERMELMVVHIHQEEDSIPLSIDLTHEGSIWFQVSRVTKGSQLLKDSGVVTGDWLVSVNGLWCNDDNANLTSFQSQLSKRNHDLVLVFARGEKPEEIAEIPSAKPVPLPRTRSTNNQHAGDQILNVARNHDFIDAGAELSPGQENVLQLIEKSKGANKILSTSEQEAEHQQHFSEESTPVRYSLPQPDQEGTLPEQVSPLTNQVPPLLDEETLLLDLKAPLPEERPVHIDQAHLIPRQTSPPSSQVSPISDEASLKGTPQLQKESTQTSPKKIPQPVNEELAFPVELDQVSKTDLSKNNIKAYSAKSEINGAPLISSGELVTSSLRKPELRRENLPAKTSSSSVDSSHELGPGIHKVVMIKGATGVGFCLEGGICSPKGNMPITIKRIFKGGPAEKCGKLKVRDEILEVNGVKFDSMRHYEAWNHLKFLDDGEIHITIHRP